MELEGFTEVSVILRSGVYALCKNGVVIYVGKAKNLYSRIYTHRNLANRGAKGQKIPAWLPVKGLKFDQVFVRYCHMDQLDEVEREMINLYKPKYNMSLKNGLKVTQPITLVINGHSVSLNQPPAPKLERRV